jgi:hypothetical protein
MFDVLRGIVYHTRINLRLNSSKSLPPPATVRETHGNVWLIITRVLLPGNLLTKTHGAGGVAIHVNSSSSVDQAQIAGPNCLFEDSGKQPVAILWVDRASEQKSHLFVRSGLSAQSLSVYRERNAPPTIDLGWSVIAHGAIWTLRGDVHECHHASRHRAHRCTA